MMLAARRRNPLRLTLLVLGAFLLATTTARPAAAQCTVTFCQSCPADPTCAACNNGFVLNSNTCLDINECATNNGGCSASPPAQCSNTPGSRTCACPSGYGGNGITCSDINECATNGGGCDPLTICTNTPGSRTCSACPSGYAGSGETVCNDVNECATANGGCAVPPAGQCTNTPGSRSCTCTTGYTGNGITCPDVNECATNNGGCSANPLVACSNVPGSRTCGSCPSGYSGDGVSCADVNECATVNGGCSTSPLVACTNTAGSRTCGTCPSGYAGNGISCSDINECAVNAGGCDPLTTCSNTAGSRDCSACPSGYDGTGTSGCTDVNECQASNPCNGGTCTNDAGTFTCDCPAGLTGTVCDINGYVPPDKPTADCAKAVANNVAKYVKCITKCRVAKAGKAFAGKNFDEQECQSGPGKGSCRSAYDKKMLALANDGICPDCLDATAQSAIADDALAALIGTKGRTYCAQSNTPLAP